MPGLNQMVSEDYYTELPKQTAAQQLATTIEAQDQIIDDLSTQVVLLKHKLVESNRYANLEVDDLEKDKRVEVKNAEAAVRVWKQLLERGTPNAKDKFKEAYKRYEDVCRVYRVKLAL